LRNFKAQEVDITSVLRKIESGDLNEAEKIQTQYLQSNPNDPSVLFLDAVLTHDGDAAAGKYSKIAEKFPKSKYADAAVYRLYSYYYAKGLYEKAKQHYNRLKIDFPQSPYTIIANRAIPEKEESQIKPPPQKLDIAKEKSDSTIYFIQAGAFLSIENATRLSDQLRVDGYNAVVSSKDVGGTVLKIVSIGEFGSEGEASSILSLIETKYKLKGRIIKK
jgi:tetratricopeptide (TPR) repeat protein